MPTNLPPVPTRVHKPRRSCTTRGRSRRHPPRPVAGPAETASAGEIERFLQEALTDLPPDAVEGGRPGAGRPRVLPALCLWAGLLVCVLRGFTSQLALWRLLAAGDMWWYPRFPVSDQAVYARLAKAGTAPLERLFQQISDVLAQRLAPYVTADLAPFATDVLVLDETRLDPVARTLPVLRALSPGDRRLLAGRLSGLFDVRRQQWRRVEYHPDPLQREQVAARAMLSGLAPGSLLLADLGYFSFTWFDDLTDGGFWWVSRLRARTTYAGLHTFYAKGETFDGLVWLGPSPHDHAGHAVRLVRFRVGPTRYAYLTNALDPAVLPLREVARLYARRWDIELAFKTAKSHLRLHLLWSAKPVVVLQQVWAVLIIAQVLQALRLEIAGRAGVDPFDVSLPLLIEYLPQFASHGEDPLALVLTRGRELGFIRPSTRRRTLAPWIGAHQIVPCPPGLPLVRQARHQGRRGPMPPPAGAH
jgi:hypothetical protein